MATAMATATKIGFPSPFEWWPNEMLSPRLRRGDGGGLAQPSVADNMSALAVAELFVEADSAVEKTREAGVKY
jgi:hypothetical protein